MVAQQVSHTSEGESRTRYYRQMYNDHEQIIYQFDIVLMSTKTTQQCQISPEMYCRRQEEDPALRRDPNDARRPNWDFPGGNLRGRISRRVYQRK